MRERRFCASFTLICILYIHLKLRGLTSLSVSLPNILSTALTFSLSVLSSYPMKCINDMKMASKFSVFSMKRVSHPLNVTVSSDVI